METREIKEKVLRIMALAMDVSHIIENKEGLDYPDIFIYFHPHVSLFEVFTYEHGYTSDRVPEKEWNVYLHRSNNDIPESVKSDKYFGCEVLDEIIAYLEDLKNG